MSDLRIPSGQIATLDKVEGELKVGHDARIQAENGKTIVVTKGVFFESSAKISGDLECDSLECHRGRLEVNGNLTVHKRLDVGHSIEVQGIINAQDIDVGGKIFAGAIICNRIRVGGRADIQNAFEASSVDVGGKVNASGMVKLGDLRVGGEAEFGGGSISGNITVGGKFSSKQQLEFGELLVYGKGFLPANCKGHRVSTYGKLEVDGNLTCDFIEAGGSIEIQGDCHAQRVEIGGKLEVSGSLFSDRVEGYGNTEIEGTLETNTLRISGKLEANKIIAREEADISGKIETDLGLKAKQLTVRSGSRCEGFLIGERVEVGKSADLSYVGWGMNWATKWAIAGGMARVDDIYATEVVIGPMCRVGRIFADTVKLEQGSAAEQVTYTNELKIDFGAVISEPPKKVTILPNPPF